MLNINNYILLIFIFVFFGCNQKGTKSKAIYSKHKDSLSVYLELARKDSLPFKTKRNYANKALDIVLNQKNHLLNRENLFKIAGRFYDINDFHNFGKTVKIVLKRSKYVKDSVNIARGYTYLGDYFNSISVTDSAFISYYKAEKLYLKLSDSDNLASIYLRKADILFIQRNYIESEIEVFKALKVFQVEKNNEVFYGSYNLLGLIYNELGAYDQSIEYNQKALTSIDDKVSRNWVQPKASTLFNLGYVYQRKDNNKQAIFYFQQALKQDNLLVDFPKLYARILDELGYSKYKSNDFNNLPYLFFQSLKVKDSLDFGADKMTTQIHLSEYYAFKKDTLTALKFSYDALASARKSQNRRNVLAPLKQLVTLEPKKAASFTNEYIHIDDSLQMVERNMGNKFSRIEYETDKIKGEYSDLEVKNRNLVYIFSFLTILGLFIYIVKVQKAKTRELLYKQQQQKANEDIYDLMINQQNTIDANRVEEKKRVAQELHDGVLGRMFGVRMNLESLNKFNDTMAIDQRSSYIVELKNIEQDIREISHDLNREKSELINNFVAIVDNFFEEQRKTFHTNLQASIDTTINWDSIPNTIKINVFRIMQESIQNINKYANADTINIELKKVDGDIKLVVKDNGIGFNTNLKKNGIGLQNMISRTKECQGTFNIQSKIGEGAIVTVTIPMKQTQIPT